MRRGAANRRLWALVWLAGLGLLSWGINRRLWVGLSAVGGWTVHLSELRQARAAVGGSRSHCPCHALAIGGACVGAAWRALAALPRVGC